MSTTVLTGTEGKPGLSAAVLALEEGQPSLEAVERGIRIVESDTSIRTVGKAGLPNLLGEVECDASIMDGQTLQCGAVGALCGFAHPITVARQVMQQLPHVLLVGEGAARFAHEMDCERDEMLTPEADKVYREWLNKHVPESCQDAWPRVPMSSFAWTSATHLTAKGTTVYLVVDDAGNLAAGGSTSGWAYKYPGRLGDTPIIGAGIYADNRLGACACTHTGEMAIRAGTAMSVVRYLQRGASVEQACHEAVNDLRALRSGYLGPVVIHALDREGDICVLSTSHAAASPYHLWTAASPEPRTQDPIVVEM